MTSILCVTDDKHVIDQLRPAFAREGDTVCGARVDTALRTVHGVRPRLIILDLDTQGVAERRLLTSMCKRTPVVVLSTSVLERDVVAALTDGADDYITKPFNPSLLVSRVKAVLRRYEFVARDNGRLDGQETTYRIDGAVFEPSLHRIVDGVVCIALTPTQSRILHLLLAHETEAVSTERVVSHLQEWGSAPDKGVIRTHIRYLRQKVAQLPANPYVIQTVHGVGYMARKAN